MSEEQKRTWIYKQEEIFQDISDDPDNVLMNIPDEVAERANLKPGDTIKILVGDQGTMIIEKVNKEEDEQKESE